jgi:hypothetical protein
MPINPNLLIASPTFQDVLVDKDGEPMSAGIVTCYHDNSRTTLKNWYYQSGTPGHYTYIRLPNPLTLSAAGTICDVNGVDTIPFFYPYDETNQNIADPYYITIVNHDETNQITRANFPFVPTSGGSDNTTTDSFNNLIANSGLWRNALPNSVNVTPYSSIILNDVIVGPDINSLYAYTVAPSQHDGFRLPDIQFMKNNTSATDVLTFTPFPLANTQPIDNYIVPEYYANHICNVAGSGETQKFYQFPISLHVNTLANVPFTVAIQAQNGGGSSTGQNAITLYIFQDTGTGTTSPVPIEIGAITLTTAWEQYTFTGVMPATAGLTLSAGGDDALYLQVQMPLNLTCEINFTKPSIFLTHDVIPNNSFQTYDQVDAIINSPRTGDIRTSFNGFYYYGWLPMNDGTIGNNGSIATTRANQDTWQLYSLLWNMGKPYDSGSNFNPLFRLLDSSNLLINYGTTAIADFTADNVLELSQQIGKVLLGTVPLAAILPAGFTQTITASNSGGNLLITITSTTFVFQGQPITFTTTGTLPGNIVANAVYYVTKIDTAGANTFQVATTYANAIARTPVVAFSSAGSNSTVYMNTTAAHIGEYAHIQQATELVNHTHTLSGFAGLANNAAGAAGATDVGTASGTAATLGVVGFTSQNAANITQPGVFYNMFIKL